MRVYHLVTVARTRQWSKGCWLSGRTAPSLGSLRSMQHTRVSFSLQLVRILSLLYLTILLALLNCACSIVLFFAVVMHCYSSGYIWKKAESCSLGGKKELRSPPIITWNSGWLCRSLARDAFSCSICGLFLAAFEVRCALMTIVLSRHTIEDRPAQFKLSISSFDSTLSMCLSSRKDSFLATIIVSLVLSMILISSSLPSTNSSNSREYSWTKRMSISIFSQFLAMMSSLRRWSRKDSSKQGATVAKYGAAFCLMSSSKLWIWQTNISKAWKAIRSYSLALSRYSFGNFSPIFFSCQSKAWSHSSPKRLRLTNCQFQMPTRGENSGEQRPARTFTSILPMPHLKVSQ